MTGGEHAKLGQGGWLLPVHGGLRHGALQPRVLRSRPCTNVDTGGEFSDVAGCEFQVPQKCRRLINVYAISFIP